MHTTIRNAAFHTPEILFEPGEIVETPSALALLRTYNFHPIRLLARHLFGDWGDVSITEAHTNDRALTEHARIVSSYLMPGGERLCIVTECDRSVTKFMLPIEFRRNVGLVGDDPSTVSAR